MFDTPNACVQLQKKEASETSFRSSDETFIAPLAKGLSGE
jgi:hypothetical protein